MLNARATITALVCLVLVVGCAPQREPGPAEPSASPSSEPTPEASSTPSAEPSSPPSAPSFEELVISPEGVGPLTIGSDAEASMMLTFYPDYCLEYNPTYPAGEDAGRWIADYTSSDGVLPFTVQVDDAGSVTNIDITTAELATAEGIRIGSTIEDLRATYPDLVDSAANPASSTHLLETPTSVLLFEAVTAESSAPELAGQIALIRIVEPGSPWLGEAFATDSLIGGCL